MSISGSIYSGCPERAKKDPRQMGALALAYIGDTVYDLYVRSFLISDMGGNAHALHIKAAEKVCAAGQAAAYRRIETLLTEEESAVFHRGRNAHSGTVPKNASVTDYRIATGMEALFGYLYLSGKDERMSVLMRTILDENFKNEGAEETRTEQSDTTNRE